MVFHHLPMLPNPAARQFANSTANCDSSSCVRTEETSSAWSENEVAMCMAVLFDSYLPISTVSRAHIALLSSSVMLSKSFCALRWSILLW